MLFDNCVAKSKSITVLGPNPEPQCLWYTVGADIVKVT